MGNALALYDFTENIKNPSYKISFPASKKVLTSYGLLDDSGNVHKAVAEAFRKFEK